MSSRQFDIDIQCVLQSGQCLEKPLRFRVGFKVHIQRRLAPTEQHRADAAGEIHAPRRPNGLAYPAISRSILLRVVSAHMAK